MSPLKPRRSCLSPLGAGGAIWGSLQLRGEPGDSRNLLKATHPNRSEGPSFATHVTLPDGEAPP